jgi:hypothetical protein
VDLSDIAFKEEQPSLVKKISKVILEEISKVRRTKEELRTPIDDIIRISNITEDFI